MTKASVGAILDTACEFSQLSLMHLAANSEPEDRPFARFSERLKAI